MAHLGDIAKQSVASFDGMKLDLWCPIEGYTWGVMGRLEMADVDVLLKPREAAAALGVSYATVKQWILAGTLKTIKTPGGHHRVRQSALTPMMKSAPKKEKMASRDRFRQVSGRNQLVGQIVEVKFSGLLAKVVLSIGEQRITSIITADAAREMQLRKGQIAGALMKATEVMIVRV
jgi:molybdopterin-binding protein